MNLLLKNTVWLIIFIIILTTFIFYYPALDGPYIADDHPNLLENNHVAITSLDWQNIKEAAFSSPSSQFYRPVSMLTFALNYYYSDAPYNFMLKLTNLVLHLLCGLGFYVLCVQILVRLESNNEKKNKLIALSVASLWLLHPLHVTTVLYVIQRMAILSTFFVVYGCVVYIHLRQRWNERTKYFYTLIFSIISFTLFGFFSKENGALLCGFLLLIEYFLFQFKFNEAIPIWQRLFLKSTLVLPVIGIVSYLVFSYVTSPAGELAQYYFSLNDRVLTQFRVLWQYVAWLFLLDTQSMGFHHDDIVISSSLMQPVTTLVAIISWLTVIVLSIRFIRTRNIIIFGVFWFLWGHVLESTVLPLVPVYEHRNYLPGFGLILALVWSLARFSFSGRINKVVGGVIFTVLVYLLPAGLLSERVATWESEKTLAASLLKQHPKSPATYMWAGLYLSEIHDYENAILAIKTGQKLIPRELAFSVVETRITCQQFPKKGFPEALSNHLDNLSQAIKPTMLLKIQLSSMIDECANSAANKDVLYNFYNTLINSNDKYIQFLAYYGRGTTLVNKGDKEHAIQDWEQAYQLYPNRTGLKKAILALKTKH